MSQSARTEHLAPDVARWLVGDAGRAARQRVLDELDHGEDVLAVLTRLRGDGLDGDRAGAAVSAAEAHRRAPLGMTERGDLVLTRSALEQASDPLVSAWRAQRYDGRVVADLGCGVGGDLLALAERARRVVGVERDAARAILADHNVRATGATRAHVVVGDALRVPVRVDAVHADPSRRVGGRRARALGEYGPSVGALLASVPTLDVGVVVSPAVDWHDPELPTGAEVEFVQRGSDLVEAMLWLGDLRRPDSRATATVLDPDGHSWSRSRTDGPVDELPIADVGAVVIEVSPAAVRARLHDTIGGELGAWRVARTRAVLSAGSVPVPSPWYRSWRVETVLPAQPKPVKRWLRQADDAPLEIATSGFDADPETWWRQLGKPARGPQGRRLLLARLDDRSVALALRPA